MQPNGPTNNTRRTFLRRPALAGVSAVSLPRVALAAASALSAQKTAFGSTDRSDHDANGYTILFQGDSITAGGRSHDMDWNHLTGSGFVNLISSNLWYRFPRKEFHFINRGVSGNKITDLASRCQADTIDQKPDILSILVGVNDVDSVMDNSSDFVDSIKHENEYRSLLQTTKAQLPNVQLILCEPFILLIGRTKERYHEWLDEIKKRHESVLKLSKEFNAVYVNFQDVFNDAIEKAPIEYWIWDGIHPMPAGHQLMAN